MGGALTFKPTYYQALRRLTLEIAGVNLGDEHKFLVETRLSALARKEGFETLTEMIDELFSRGQTRLAIKVVSALMERASSFFEDRTGYKLLGDTILPALYPLYIGRTVRILSYGCSSGQEVYSTAIVVDRLSHVYPEVNFEIVGVDYPSWALERARAGRFTHFEVQRGLPIRHLIEYFDRDGEDWLVKDKLKRSVSFADHNLLADTNELGGFQAVLFRGRLSQYSPAATVRVLRCLSRLVTGYGYLMLGSSESLGGLNYGFEHETTGPGLYCKKPDAAPIIDEEEPFINAAPPKPVFTKDSSAA